MGVETLFALHLHHLRMADAQQMQRAPDRAGVHRLPKPVEHEHGLFQERSPYRCNKCREVSKASRFGNRKAVRFCPGPGNSEFDDRCRALFLARSGLRACSAPAMKILVAYSGGLDTSVLLLWLKEKYNAEIIAYCADVGQGDELDGLEAKALSTGASKCFIGDLKEDFAANYIFPMIQANAIYEGRYLLGTSIARPCITKGMMDVALAEGADAIAHGATGKGNDQVRFELSAASLAPNVKCIAPWRDAEFRKQFPGRSEMIAYAEAHNIPIKASMKKPYSMDRNLLHISFEAGAMEDPWYDATTPADSDMYVLSVSPEDAPDKPEYIEILFEKGNAIGLKHEEPLRPPRRTRRREIHRRKGRLLAASRPTASCACSTC